jgi:hypothetical protein
MILIILYINNFQPCLAKIIVFKSVLPCLILVIVFIFIYVYLAMFSLNSCV